MKTKKIESKLKLNKITIARLNHLEMSEVLGLGCPPPSIGEQDTCPHTVCVKCTWSDDKGTNTAG